MSYPFCDLADQSAIAVPVERAFGQSLYMLIDEQYAYVFPIMGVPIERLFDGGGFGFGIDDEKVLLGIGRLGYVLKMRYKNSPLDH